MIKTIVIAYCIVLYLSIPGFIGKAGYNWLLGFIPFLNIYLFIRVLNIKPILLILIGILLIISPFRSFIATAMIVYLPFMIGDCYETNLTYSFLGLIMPFFIFPFIAYFHGYYLYEGVE